MKNVCQSSYGVKTSIKGVQDVFKTSSRRLQDILEEEKLLRSIMTKANNYLVISLDLGYVLHHCNTEQFLIYWHEYSSVQNKRGGYNNRVDWKFPRHLISERVLKKLKIEKLGIYSRC